MSLPRKAVLGPFTYRITESRKEWEKWAPEIAVEEDWWGYTHHASATILIQPNINPALQRTVLMHELLHACCFSAGMLDTRKRDEETWVAMVAPMVLDSIARSPGMTDFLFGRT